jgi:hypothetical protein
MFAITVRGVVVNTYHSLLNVLRVGNRGLFFMLAQNNSQSNMSS